jgi:hypothetical protein
VTLTRWTDEVKGGLEGRAGELLRRAREARLPPPPPWSVALRAPRRRRRLSRGLVLVLLLPVGALAGVLLTALVKGPWLASRSAVRAATAAATLPEITAGAAPMRAASPGQPPRQLETLQEPARSTSPRGPRSANPGRRAALPPPLAGSAQSAQSRGEASPVDEPSAPSSPLAEEAHLVGVALDALRRGRPEVAVEVTSTYRDRFPGGVLSFEAVLAEVRAHRALRRLDDALAAVDRAAEGPAAARVELQVLRGELLAERGDCGAALVALDAALAGTLAGAFEERAVATRADCSVAREEPGAAGWLERYLSGWPRGPFAARARALLEARTGNGPEGGR